MILKKIIISILPILLLNSCVGEDIITDTSLLVPNLSFDKRLESVAIDENTLVNLRLIIGNEPIDLKTTSQFDISFSSSNTNIFEIDSKGVISPKPSSLNKKASVIIRLEEKDVESPRVATIEDDITVGRVTISENEANLIKEKDPDRLKKLISEGYDPKITITNLVKVINVNNSDGILLSAVFQNIKNEVEEVPFTWISSNESILTVSTSGLIKPVTKGSVQVTVNTNFNDEDISFKIPIEVAEKDEVEKVEVPVKPDSNSLGSGQFQTNSSYPISGSFEIVNQGGKNVIKLSDNFNADGVPDLVIYLSNSITSNAGAPALAENSNVTSLPDFKVKGAQTIAIPDTINPADFKNVLLYCRRFGVKVGFGIINR